MSASKNRPRWAELPPSVRGQISELAGGRVVAAQNCEGKRAATRSRIFDALPHNIMRAAHRVLFVDWPHGLAEVPPAL
jgi:hypothetical protein